jgi:thiol-disulfide isomerase/thioredoxin
MKMYKKSLSLIVIIIVIYLIIRFSSVNSSLITLKNNEKVDFNTDCVFVVAADWCGHCKKLKESGELEKVYSRMPVKLIPHDHPGTASVMKQVESNGFPTIIISKLGKAVKYDGQRTSEAILDYYRNM